MIQALIVKTIIGQVMKAIERADDNRIARSHNKRLKALEKIAHKQADFICMKCVCKAKRVEKPKKGRKKK